MSTISKIIEKWKNYRYRFTPWIVFNLRNRIKESSTRIVNEEDDTLVSVDLLEQILNDFFNKLKKYDNNGVKSLNERNKQVMLDEFGYIIDRKPSNIPGGGLGVFVTKGSIKKGNLVALYPGTIYKPYEPILLPSIRNKFVFRCSDGTHIDGKDCGLSKIIYKSVAGRDRIGPYEIADLTWLGNFPINPLNIGQYVNNSNREYPCNVAYQEFNLTQDFPINLLSFLPYAQYSSSNNQFSTRRIVALIATTDINKDTEILSSYYTVIGK